MGKTDLPGKSPKLSMISTEDIPEAKRITKRSRQSSSLKPILIGIGVASVSFLALAGGTVLNLGNSSSSESSETDLAETASGETETPDDETLPEPSPPPASETENIFGHLPYEQSPLSELQAVTGDQRIKLRKVAAQKFLAMQGDARSQGIILTALSGFRSQEEQERLFFEIKAQRGQVASTRAKVSAPPGYSEHHTGYAIDIGDGKTPATNVSESFEKTAAFAWLEKNAARYSFELSFPRDNVQGISYEPWHWRFVGDSHSLKTFYKATELLIRQNPETNSQ